jgi:D-arabinose 1-dehydrogenase-like Zn-dependent alcohol dehydrogenase
LHGFTHDGTFQQYAVSYTNHLTRIPDGLGLDEAAPVLCAGVTVYKAIKQSGVRVGQWIALPGAGGGLGHLAIQYAQAQGLRVIAIDTGEEKKKLCEKLGAEVWIDFKEHEDIVKAIKSATPDGLGPHASIVTAAQASGYEQALGYIRPGGVVVAVGLPPGAVIKSEVFSHVLYEKKLIVSIANGVSFSGGRRADKNIAYGNGSTLNCRAATLGTVKMPMKPSSSPRWARSSASSYSRSSRICLRSTRICIRGGWSDGPF